MSSQSASQSEPTPAAPEPGETTLVDVLDSYADGGFASSFVVTEDAHIECVACGVVSPSSRVQMSSLRRLEGESDPDDMMAVVALMCPACGAHGTVTLGYGPMASAQDADVLGALRDHRGDNKAPGNSAPGETAGDD
ncbi:MAG TPA: hypothetical protein VGM78_15565 [Ilumatobacteraceae bacterium]|jgi:hypothetical protein